MGMGMGMGMVNAALVPPPKSDHDRKEEEERNEICHEDGQIVCRIREKRRQTDRDRSARVTVRVSILLPVLTSS